MLDDVFEVIVGAVAILGTMAFIACMSLGALYFWRALHTL
jgi:hypothetical protein